MGDAPGRVVVGSAGGRDRRADVPNAAGIIPVVEALLGKGAALGTVLAFTMSVIALSAPEAVILHKVLKPRLIATFFAIVAAGVLLVGWLINLVV